MQAPPEALRGCVLAMGNFDGLHRGHLALLNVARREAKRLGAPLGVMSFSPHPRRFFQPDAPDPSMMAVAQKIRALQEQGVEVLWLLRFTEAFSRLNAAEFVALLRDRLGVAELVTGEDVRFGYKRQGDAAFLASHTPKLAHRTVPALLEGGEAVSSTRLRAALAAGDMPRARALLGRACSIEGKVVGGDRRGRELGFPTANIRLGGRLLPAYGIYAARLVDAVGRAYPAVANLGIRPMWQSPVPLLETHLLDTQVNLYGQRVSVELWQWLRDEAKFDDIEALKAQIARDSDAARDFWRRHAAG